MNKSQLVDAIAAKTGLKKKDADAAFTAFVNSISEALASGDKVQVTGLGSFEVKERGARTGRNPKTHETITIPATKYPAFSASKVLKDSVKG